MGTTKEQRLRRVKIARDYVLAVKNKSRCAHCQENHIATLTFHHLDPSKKKFNISCMPNRGTGIIGIKAEMDKCIILCANCHKILHYNERQANV